MYCPCTFFPKIGLIVLICSAQKSTYYDFTHSLEKRPSMKNSHLFLFLFFAFFFSHNSIFAQNVGIGTTNPLKKLEVHGAGGLGVNSTNNGTGVSDWIAANFGGTAGDRVVMGILNGNPTIGAHNNALNAWAKLYLSPVGGINIGSLAGSGLRMVVADAAGDLSAVPVPFSGGGTVTSVSASPSASNPIIVTNNTTNPTISMFPASSSQNGYLSKEDWTYFNSKLTLPILTPGSLVFSNSNGTSLAQNNARLFWDNTNNRLGVGTNTPSSTMQVSGTAGLRVSSTNTGTGAADWIAGNFGGTAGDRVIMGNLNGNATIGAHDNALSQFSKLVINPGGTTAIGSLAGTGTRMVVANASGELSAQAFASDNLGNHTATQTVNLNNNTISNDGTAKGMKMTNDGHVGVNIVPQGTLDVAKSQLTYNQNYTPMYFQHLVSGDGVPVNFCGCPDATLDSYYRAFDGNLTSFTGLSSSNLSNESFSIGQDYEHPRASPKPGPRVIRRYRIVISNHYKLSTGISVTYRFYGSNSDTDGHDRVLLHNNSVTANSIDLTHDLTNTTAYRYYFVKILVNEFSYNVYQGKSDPPHISELYFFEEGAAVTYSSGAFTVKPDGNVGVGTNAPTANLDVTGTVRLRNGAAPGAILTSDASGNATWAALNNFTSTGGIKVSTSNNGTNATDWIALNAGNSATGTGSNTDRFVAGNVNNVVTFGGHNKDLNAWTDVAITPGGTAMTTVGGPSRVTPPIGNTTTGVPIKMNVNGSVRQGYYGISVNVPKNNIVTYTWSHNLGYNPIIMTSLDQTGGGYYMDFCTVVTTSLNANQVQFIIRNLGNNDALGSMRWILVW
jgi:hypothetical protein